MKPVRTALRALAAGCLLIVVATTPARADEALDAIAQAVGVTEQATDFVILVDTSVSMKDDDRWARARDAVSGLLTNLTPDDHVTLITFDDGARTAFAGLDPAPATVLNALPASPTGDQTDIGAAIEAGVEALNRDGGSEVAAIALLTDGELDAAETSDYVTPTSPAWAELRQRAATVSTDRQIGAFALTLGSTSDAGLLTSVFPNAEVATPNDIVAYLTGLNDELTRLRIVEALGPDLEGPASLTVGDATIEDGTLTATATLASSTTYLPLTIASVALEPAVEGAAIGMEPAAVEVAPGQSATATLTVTLPPGTESTSTVVATLTSPWAPQLTALGIDQNITAASQAIDLANAAAEPAAPTAEPTATPPATATDTPADSGRTLSDTLAALPVWALPAAGGAVLALLLLLALLSAARKRRPRLDGSIAVLHEGRIVDEFIVAGADAAISRGELKLKARRLKDGTVALKGRHGQQKFTATLGDGDTTRLTEATELRYTDQRTRMLQLISDTHATTGQLTGP